MTNKHSTEDQFLEFYHAQILNHSRRTTRLPAPRYFVDPADADVIKDSRDFWYSEYQDLKFEHDQVLLVELPSRSLATLSRKHHEFTSSVGAGGGKVALDILNQKWEEKRIRDINPAVQLAWEQYSLMLHLASNNKSPG